MDPLAGIHSRVLDSSLLISEHLKEGDSVSQKLSRILTTQINVLRESPMKFDKMRKELDGNYRRLSELNNKLYQEAGGQLGSGAFVHIGLDELSPEYTSFLEGVSPVGFELLQKSIGALTQMKTRMPMDREFIERLLFAHWITLLSLHDPFERDEVIRTSTKYDVNFS